MAMVFVPGNPAYFVEVGDPPEKESKKVSINAGDRENFELTKKEHSKDDQYIIQLFVEEGEVRVRTDGKDCTFGTGQPMGEGYSNSWNASSISVKAIEDSVITVVYR